MGDLSNETDESFGARLLDAPTQGFLAIGLSLGEELGLWDVLERLDRPVSHHELAQAAQLKPRYIYLCNTKSCTTQTLV